MVVKATFPSYGRPTQMDEFGGLGGTRSGGSSLKQLEGNGRVSSVRIRMDETKKIQGRSGVYDGRTAI